jgi:hypothetical protein
MQNFWGLLLALSSLTSQHTVADVARLTKITLELKSEDALVRDYQSTAPIQLQLNIGTVIATVGVTEPIEKKNRPLFVILQNIHGVCLLKSMLEEYMTEFSAPVYPPHPMPQATITQRAKFNGRYVWLYFSFNKPRCLTHFNFDIRPGEHNFPFGGSLLD